MRDGEKLLEKVYHIHFSRLVVRRRLRRELNCASLLKAKIEERDRFEGENEAINTFFPSLQLQKLINWS